MIKWLKNEKFQFFKERTNAKEFEEITCRAVMISKQNTGGNKSGY